MAHSDPRYHQLVFLWIHDPAMFSEYLRALPPIVSRYGGAADRVFQPTAIHADDMDLPHAVNLVHYTDRESFARFGEDPGFRAIEHLRSGSCEMAAFGGHLERESPLEGDRLYGIEVVRYRDGSPAAYREYEARGEDAMRRYGYEVEYVVRIDEGEARGQRFDLAKVSSFPSAAARTAFEDDPMHKVIETELYPAAVERAIWVDATGRREVG